MGGKVQIEWPKGMLPDHFRDLVNKCMLADPVKRLSAKKLLKHPFFTNDLKNMKMSIHPSGIYSNQSGQSTGLYGNESMLMTEYSPAVTVRKPKKKKSSDLYF